MDIIAPINKALIRAELNDSTFVRRTNNGKKEIFIISHFNAPNTIQEIGRLREISFRDAGGGSGKSVDLDEHDLSDIPFKQLIVWDPSHEEIVGGYRFLEGYEILRNASSKLDTPTAHLFDFGQKFIQDYLPQTFELGRSFVQPNYQPNYNVRKGLYSLDNLWDGLGYLIVSQPSMEYFFGKITMYPNFNAKARDMIHYFLDLHFGDHEKLVFPSEPLLYKTDIDDIKPIFKGIDYLEDYKILNQQVRKFGENIPPLVNAYMNLSPGMKYFGTSINHDFGAVEESGILIKISDIYEAKKARHIYNISEKRIDSSELSNEG
jgi:hypothetical protein